MKKALILTTVSGFLIKFELDHVRILQDLGYEIHYAANTHEKVYDFEPEELKKRRITMHHIPIAKSPFRIKENREALKQLERLIRREQIQLIHCHTPVGGLLGRLAAHRCRDRKVKVIYTSHGFHFYKGCPALKYWVFYAVEKYLAKYTDAIVVINKEDYESAGSFRLKGGGGIYRIPGVGLDCRKFHPMEDGERMRVRRALGVDGSMTLFLSVGELNRNKNHIVILDALCRMRDQGTDLKKFRYLICGEGPGRESMERQIARRGLQQIVILYGYCKTPEEIYGAADLFFFPSRREGLGMAALEALSSGVPVAAADNRGSREYLIPGKNGYRCRWNVPEDYMRAVWEWSHLSPAEQQKMKEACRASVKKFERNRSASVMETVYRTIDETIES